ncbi:TonB family protein [Undibacterium sp. Ren11W]|uniref:TonB family protein n=1 Tax=Undibacterium sp. Ren11W TaxID=3413045 RepID=UPI003BF0E0F1
MRVLLNAVLLLLFTQTLNLPAAAQSSLTVPPSITPSEAVATELPKKNDLKIDPAKDCSIPAYPDSARRFGMQGDTILNLMIDDSGKINAFQLIKSSGWKFLDQMVMHAIIGCQVLPAGRWIPSERQVIYWWQFDKGYTSRAVLDISSCKASEKLRIANEQDKELGIVVGIYTSDTGKVLDAKVQWGSDDEQLDRESLRIAKSCEYAPAERSGKRIGNADSIRFVAKAAQ